MSSKFSFVESSDYYFSRNLPDIQITDSLVKEYLRIKIYNFNGVKVDLGDGNIYSLDPTKYDLKPFDNINVGWKIHLNINVDKVLEVSDFLIKNGFLHKYLTGRNSRNEEAIQNGKIFTVYFGSWKKLCEGVIFIKRNISSLLSKPKAKGEIEFESGIVGRFVVVRGRGIDEMYHQYGKYGIPYTNDLVRILRTKSFTSREKEIEYFEAIFNELVKDFGEYFVDLNKIEFREND